jgi:dUTP pyrophosphatase
MMNKIQIRILRLPHAADFAVDLPLPAYESADAAGLDLLAALPADPPLIIAPGQRAAIPTGLAFACPTGIMAQIVPRSGLALMHGITVLNSPHTLDSDYRGEVHVILANFGAVDFRVVRGAPIARLVLLPTVQASIHEASSVDELMGGPR